MNHSAYQRFVFGYHGCDATVADQAILTGKQLSPSENDYDWLGKGIYFWEHGPERALEWAHEKKRQGEIKKPAVVGALIHLGNCFDLLDIRSTASFPKRLRCSETACLLTDSKFPRTQADSTS